LILPDIPFPPKLKFPKKGADIIEEVINMKGSQLLKGMGYRIMLPRTSCLAARVALFEHGKKQTVPQPPS